ncbi:hypothetical protein CRG98_020676 [Punica granatum]|uniref:Protein PHYTOCHROME KINASE SUBSTRATE 4-like n=1 Tax=Punica granatum TaxID=22663 RepID=A0A2I0JSR3_PUNGR|nr:hypothetical protein CRG98_020676 [Punica granatum]
MRSSVSSNLGSTFPQPRTNRPAFPFHSSSFRQKKLSSLMATDFSFSAYLRPTNDDDDGCGENRAVVAAAAPGDLELSIFDARKYFTETSIDPIPCATKKISQPVPRFSTDSSVDGFSRSYRTRLYRSCATPTASSEASWNSHTGLLSNPPGAIPVSLRNPASDRKSGSRCSSPRWLLFLRECPCSSKKSVQVQKTSSESRSPASRNNCSPKLGEAAISKIKLDNSTGKVTSKPELFVENMQNIVLDAHTRFSNEGFTFPVLNPSTSSSSLPFNRKLLIHDFPPKTASAVIASLPLPLTEDPPRDSLEPSEASITWSVNTAEGTAFDHASVTNYSVSASDVEEFTRIQLRQHKELERSGGGVGGGGGKRRGGGGGTRPTRAMWRPGQAGELLQAGNVSKPPAASDHSTRLSQILPTQSSILSSRHI